MTLVLLFTILTIMMSSFADETVATSTGSDTPGGDASGGDSPATETQTDSTEIDDMALDGVKAEDEPEAETEEAQISDPTDDVIPSVGKDTPKPKEEEADSKTAPAETKEAKPEEKSPAFDPEFVKKAATLGFTEDEVKAFGTPERLVGMINMIGERVRQQIESQAKPAEAPKAKAEAETPAKVNPETDFDLDKDEFDPQLRNFSRAFKAQQSRINEFEAMLKAHDVEVQNIARERVENTKRQFEEHVLTYAKDHSDIFGEGPTDALDAKSPASANRGAIIQQAAILANGYRQLGKPVPEMKELIGQSVQTLFGKQLAEKTKTQARKEIEAELSARRKSAINRPSANSRPGKPADPEAAVREEVKKFLKEKGVKVPEEDTESAEDFALP